MCLSVGLLFDCTYNKTKKIPSYYYKNENKPQFIEIYTILK